MPMRDLDPYAGPNAFVGAQIREYRMSAVMTQKDLGAATYTHVSTVAMYERGERAATPEFLKVADKATGAEGRLEYLAPLVGSQRFPSDFRPWLPIESEAVELHSYELAVVPGLLQTEEYARALITAGQPDAQEEQIEELVRARMDRRAVLTPETGPSLYVVLDENVLHRPIGGPRVMADQLEAIVEATERQRIHVRVQVVPSDTGAHAGLAGAFVIATLPDRSEVALVDHATRGDVTDNPDEVAQIRKQLNAIRLEALPSRASVQHILKVMETWKDRTSN